MRDIEASGQYDGPVWVGVVLAFLLIGLSVVILFSRTSADGSEPTLEGTARPVTFVAQQSEPPVDAVPDRVDPIAYFAE